MEPKTRLIQLDKYIFHYPESDSYYVRFSHKTKLYYQAFRTLKSAKKWRDSAMKKLGKRGGKSGRPVLKVCEVKESPVIKILIVVPKDSVRELKKVFKILSQST